MEVGPRRPGDVARVDVGAVVWPTGHALLARSRVVGVFRPGVGSLRGIAGRVLGFGSQGLTGVDRRINDGRTAGRIDVADVIDAAVAVAGQARASHARIVVAVARVRSRA